MRTELFNKVIEAAVDRSLSMMAKKNDEYSGNADYDAKSKVNDDRLRGCKSVAEIQGVNIFRAIGGLMAKHTSSVYDLIRDTESGEVADMSVWQEKITDHINYLLLLEAAVHAQINPDISDLIKCRESIPTDSTESNLAQGIDPDRQYDNLNGITKSGPVRVSVEDPKITFNHGQPDDLNEIELRLKKHFEEKKGMK